MPETVLEDPKLENREGKPQLSVKPQRKVLETWTPQGEVHVETMAWKRTPGTGDINRCTSNYLPTLHKPTPKPA